MQYLQSFQDFLSLCGAISIVGGAAAVIWKVIAPAWRLNKRVTALETRDESVLDRLESVENIQKVQSKCLAAMLDYMITGQSSQNITDIKNDLLTSIIDK